MNYAHSSTTAGTDPADWSIVTIEPESFLPGEHEKIDGVALAEAAGHPAISLVWEEALHIRHPVHVRSTTSTRAHPSAWIGFSLFRAVDEDKAVWQDMSVVNGKPAIAFSSLDREAVFLASSTTASGGSQADWGVRVIDEAAGQLCEIAAADVNGSPAIVYEYHDYKNAGLS